MRMKIFAVVFLAFALSGCAKKEQLEKIVLPSSPVTSAVSTWAVCEYEHLRIREKPSLTAQVLSTLFSGAVMEVTGRSLGKETIDDLNDYWYSVNYNGLRGWVFGAYLSMHDSQSAAMSASREMQ